MYIYGPISHLLGVQSWLPLKGYLGSLRSFLISVKYTNQADWLWLRIGGNPPQPSSRDLKWFAIPFSSGPHSVRPLHHDPPVLGGPTRHGLVSLS